MSAAFKHFSKQMKPGEWYTCRDLEPYGGEGYPPHIAVSTSLSHIYADLPNLLRRRAYVCKPGEADRVRFEYSVSVESHSERLECSGNDFMVLPEDDMSSPSRPGPMRHIQKQAKSSGFRTLVQELEDLPKGFEIVIRRT